MTPAQHRAHIWNTVHLVPPTPFDPTGKHIDTGRLISETRLAIDAGIRVIIPGAGTGEFHSLSESEAGTVLEIVTEVVASYPNTLVLAPVGLGIEAAIRSGIKAKEQGAHGVLVMPPVHPYLSDEGIAGYFERIAQEAGIPVWVYKRGPTPSDTALLRLIDSGIIAGVKYAVNDVNAVTSFVRSVAGRAEVVCGTAERFAPFFHLAGARGFTSGAAALFPRTSLKLHAALDEGNFLEAMRLRAILEPLEAFRARQNDALNISVVKAGLALLGRNVGPARLPNRPLTTAELSELEIVVQKLQDFETTLS